MFGGKEQKSKGKDGNKEQWWTYSNRGMWGGGADGGGGLVLGRMR
jgi:hypothetical protein